MAHLITAVLLATLFTVIFFLVLDAEVEKDASEARTNIGELEPLLPLADVGQWYQQESGFTPDETYFGAYAITPMTATLYIGFGSARPAESDGALLAKWDGITVTAVSTLTEQGVIGIIDGGQTLYIPGVDPCCGNNWDWGNTYVLTTASQLIKYRNLPNVIHSWGLWLNEDSDTLYTAVSAHINNITRTGELFSSVNQAQSWQKVADRDDGIGDYRTYDVLGLSNKLYITWNDVYTEPCGLAVSQDAGYTWTRLAGIQTMCRPRLFVFRGNLLALRDDRAALFAIDAAGTAVTHTFPGFQVADWAYNTMAKDGNYLYTITDDGRVVRTANFIQWETVADSDLSLITIAYWPEKNWLVLSDRGRDGRLWKLELPANKKFLPIIIQGGSHPGSRCRRPDRT